MPVSAQATRAQEKLDLILRQVIGLRARLNWLALQHGLYLVLALVIAATAIVLAAAAILSPLAFLIVAGSAAATAAVSLVLAIRSGWRRRSNAVRAAALADERAALKGRLTTIVETVSKHQRAALWPYLIEDALAHREEFVPRQIERHRIAGSWWAPIVALIFAAALIPLARSNRARTLASSVIPPDITVDLDNLNLRPAEPDDSNGIEVQADAATMARLRARMAQQGMSEGQGGSGKAGGLLDRARNFAGSMQNKLRGESTQHQRLTLRLADKDAGLDPSNPRGADTFRKSHRGDEAGQFKREDNSSDQGASLPPIDSSQHDAEGTDADSEGGGNSQEANSSNKSSSGSDDSGPRADSDQQRGGEQSNGGSSLHGIGTDPDSLFGDASKSKMSGEGFEIAIEARPVDRGSKGAGQAYLPPKVRTPLNAHQQPDEPIARAAVPPEDRTTIQRVFER